MGRTTTEIAIGYEHTVVLNKPYGPEIFASLRITADAKRGWVIEREFLLKEQYVEWCVIPAPIDHGLDDYPPPLLGSII